jgi:hypothetical protein
MTAATSVHPRHESLSMDRIDSATLFFLNVILLVLVGIAIWGATALVLAALVAVPVALGSIIVISLTAKA